MNNVFIIHGAFGSPNENWIPWLKLELEKLNKPVITPTFPTPDNQSLENWLKAFKNYQDEITQDSIVIGHSLGVAFVLNVLEILDKPIKSAFLVSGFIDSLGDPEFDRINKTFLNRKFDFEKIRKNCKKFYVFHSDNDPYVPLKFGEDLAEKLNSELILIKNAGHFNADAGFTKFNELLEKIKND